MTADDRDYVYDEGQEQDPHPPKADPSTRAGFSSAILVLPLMVAAIGFLTAFLVTGVTWGWERAPHVGFAAALISGVLTGLLMAGREDGRLARRGRRGGQA
jgi:multisubunit Na+/H+ antiporter MnhB subunit